MNRKPAFRRRRFAALVVFGVFAITVTGLAPASAYTPESPEVKAMVARAYQFLETAGHTHGEKEFGGDCLIGLAFVKKGKDDRHPQVAKAVNKVRQALSANFKPHSQYSAAIACVFLCELDAQKYRPEIDKLLGHLLQVQRVAGGWTYDGYATGDTSQTQYGVLALWTADKHGINFSIEDAERVAGWLTRTQDPTGGWGYQGTDNGSGVRSQQGGVTLSLSAAGLSSVYICADILGIISSSGDRPVVTDLPPALRLVVDEKDKVKDRRGGAKSSPAIMRSMADGNRWFDQNYKIEFPIYQEYYLYALERYKSFKEFADGREELEPKWYNDGVELLAKWQQGDGSWDGGCSAGVDTVLAVFFLTRSTKTVIAKGVEGEGTLRGGRGFKGDVSNARLKDGKVLGVLRPNKDQDMIALIEDTKNGDYEALAEFPDALTLDTDPAKLAKQLLRLRRLVSAEKFEVRLVAVRALGRTDEYDNVPYLIYSLTDPDWRIVRMASDGLRHISRKFESPPLGGNPNDGQRRVAIETWKRWYKSVNPTAVFLD